MGLHRFSSSFAVLPQHWQIYLGLEVSFFTFSISNLCVGRLNWHILFSSILLQSHLHVSSQHEFSMIYTFVVSYLTLSVALLLADYDSDLSRIEFITFLRFW